MAEIAAKVLVVGGGPGGYVSAIRAGQLGLDVVLVEQGGLDGGLGGTCLNVGCIPSKALIHAADAYRARGRAGEVGAVRHRVERPTIDFARTIEWKNGIVGRLTSGVGALLKRHRVKICRARAVMVDGKTCRVETDTGPQVVQRRARRAGDRLGAGGAAVRCRSAAGSSPRPRRCRCRRFPNAWPSSAPAISASSSASPSPSSAPRSRWSRPPTASCRPMTRSSSRPVARHLRRWASRF